MMVSLHSRSLWPFVVSATTMEHASNTSSRATLLLIRHLKNGGQVMVLRVPGTEGDSEALRRTWQDALNRGTNPRSLPGVTVDGHFPSLAEDLNQGDDTAA